MGGKRRRGGLPGSEAGMAGVAAVQEEENEDEDLEDRAEAYGPCIALRLVAAAAWHIVRERLVHSFPRVLALLNAVGEAAPGLVPFRHFAKMRLGLQAKVVMAMLQEEQPHMKVYDAIDMYFPERETQPHPKATSQDLTLVLTAQENFRELVFGLLRDQRHREKYIREHLENDYGEAFMQVVEELFCDYLCQLERSLPEPDIQQLLEAACLQVTDQGLQPNSNILSQYLTITGYQVRGLDSHPPSPNPSISSFQSEEEEQVGEGPSTPEPCTAQTSPARPRRGWSRPPGSQAEDANGQHPGNQGRTADETVDLVLDSNSEGDISPFRKGEYQCTQHNTLIPTFQEHVGDIENRCSSCLASVSSPAI